MTGLLGRRCTRGNALSPPLLMATRLGFLFRASSRSVRSSDEHLSDAIRLARPAKSRYITHAIERPALAVRCLRNFLWAGRENSHLASLPALGAFSGALWRCLSLHLGFYASFRHLSHLNLWMARGRIEADDNRSRRYKRLWANTRHRDSHHCPATAPG